MALPTLKTSDRHRLVYTGDPSIRGDAKPDDYSWRPATPDDAIKGATIVVVRSLSKTEHKQSSIDGAGNGEAFMLALVARGLLAVEGDARPLPEIVESWPLAPTLSLARAIERLCSETDDPFGQRSSG